MAAFATSTDDQPTSLHNHIANSYRTTKGIYKSLHIPIYELQTWKSVLPDTGKCNLLNPSHRGQYLIYLSNKDRLNCVAGYTYVWR